jgi:hypothetical protein
MNEDDDISDEEEDEDELRFDPDEVAPGFPFWDALVGKRKVIM